MHARRYGSDVVQCGQVQCVFSSRGIDSVQERKTKRITCDERSEVAALNTAEMRSLFSGGCAVLCEDFQTFFSLLVCTLHICSSRESALSEWWIIKDKLRDISYPNRTAEQIRFGRELSQPFVVCIHNNARKEIFFLSFFLCFFLFKLTVINDDIIQVAYFFFASATLLHDW